MLAILDTVAPSFDSELNARTHDPDAVLFSWATEAAAATGKTLSLSLGEFRQIDPTAQLEFVLDQLRATPLFATDTKLRQARRKLKIYQYHGRAIRNYIPRIYPGRITLFRSS